MTTAAARHRARIGRGAQAAEPAKHDVYRAPSVMAGPDPGIGRGTVLQRMPGSRPGMTMMLYPVMTRVERACARDHA